MGLFREEGRMDRRTGGQANMKKFKIAFHNFVNAPHMIRE